MRLLCKYTEMGGTHFIAQNIVTQQEERGCRNDTVHLLQKVKEEETVRLQDFE